MATLSKGYTFGASESVTNAKLHALVDSATISGIVNADIDAGAAIAFSKLAEENIDGSKLIGLENITDDGVIPVANIPIINLTNKVTGTLPRANGGLDSTVANNAASGVVFLDADSKLPAVDGSQLTGLPITPQVGFGSWVDKSASYGAQQAATDGFVLARAVNNGTIDIYTDGNADPTTARGHSEGYSNAQATVTTVPVRKGDYWKIVVSVGTVPDYVYWIPLGS